MTTLRVRAVVPTTIAEGPGRRSALWVQGCAIRCPGCFNPHLWDSEGGDDVPVGRVVAALTADPEIEGVTFLGGEPFDQAAALTEVARAVRERGLSVMVFSGYFLDDLVTGVRPGWTDLLGVTDLLVDGPFDATLPDRERPWVGSRNQRFHLLTPRYAGLADRLGMLPDRLEVRLAPDGGVFVNGQAPPRLLRSLVTTLRS